MAGKSRQNQDLAIVEALARGEGLTATATLVGCSVSTVRRRLEDPEVRAKVERFRAEMLDSAAGKLGVVIDKAVKTLEGLLTDETPPAVRLAAAKSVIELTFRTREVLSLERRVAEIEARAKSQENTELE